MKDWRYQPAVVLPVVMVVPRITFAIVRFGKLLEKSPVVLRAHYLTFLIS